MSLRSACALCVLLVIGCGPAKQGTVPVGELASQGHEVALLQADAGAAELDAAALPTSADVAASDRKIIYHARMRIEVTDFAEAVAGIESLVSRSGGFVATSRLGGQAGSTRSGHWTLRIPAERYRPFLRDLARLGELGEQDETSQEVTAEFFDLQARIRNKQQEEQRLLAHLKETTRVLPEILTIEKELSRVRGEIERMQGRLSLLADQTSLSTVELTVSEIETFVPAESPGFVTRIQRAWNGSTEVLLSVLQGSAIVAIATFPWVVVLCLLGAILLPFWLMIRRRLNVPA